jgi:hypothetical protein
MKLQGSTQLEKLQKMAERQTPWIANAELTEGDTKHPIYTGRFWIRNKKRFGSYEEWKYSQNFPPMWEHTCKIEGKMFIGEGEECNWCGEVEE